MRRDLHHELGEFFAGISPRGSVPEGGRHAWVARSTVVASLLMFVALRVATHPDEGLPVWSGSLPSESVWDGHWWALVTSALVHYELVHCAFNVFWLWILGRRMEIAVGPWAYVAFFILAAFFSSGVQLAVGGDEGIGASGVVYAIFGFMWMTRDRFAGFAQAVDDNTVKLFLGWLVFCILMTRFAGWNVGNAAHVSGALFGALVARGVFAGPRRVGYFAVLFILFSGVFAILRAAPWSSRWLGYSAYQAHEEGRLDEALELYTQRIEMEPDDPWAYHNRGVIHHERGDHDKADRDFTRSRELEGVDD